MGKIIILHNIISPIRVFLFNKLSEYYEKKGIKLKVIFLSVSDKNRNWKTDSDINFDYEILDNFAIRIAGKDLNTFFVNFGIVKTLKRENPHRVISFGWDNYAAYAANWWCRKNNKKFILWSGSTKYEQSWRRTLLRPLVKYLIKQTNGFIAYGTRSKEYLVSLGAPREKIQIFYNAVNIDYFKEKSENFSKKEKFRLKEKLGVKTKKNILFSGRLIKMKGIFEMVDGFKKYQKIDSDISLLIMGVGPDKIKLEKYIKKEKIKNVFFLNFIQYKSLYKYYAISDLLLFPSRQDIWGLTINEALTCELPIVTTEKVGASVDLVESGKNGYIIKSNNSKGIASAIEKIFENNLDKNNNSWEIVQKTRVKNNLNKLNLL